MIKLTQQIAGERVNMTINQALETVWKMKDTSTTSMQWLTFGGTPYNETTAKRAQQKVTLSVTGDIIYMIAVYSSAGYGRFDVLSDPVPIITWNDILNQDGSSIAYSQTNWSTGSFNRFDTDYEIIYSKIELTGAHDQYILLDGFTTSHAYAMKVPVFFVTVHERTLPRIIIEQGRPVNTHQIINSLNEVISPPVYISSCYTNSLQYYNLHRWDSKIEFQSCGQLLQDREAVFFAVASADTGSPTNELKIKCYAPDEEGLEFGGQSTASVPNGDYLRIQEWNTLGAYSWYRGYVRASKGANLSFIVKKMDGSNIDLKFVVINAYAKEIASTYLRNINQALTNNMISRLIAVSNTGYYLNSYNKNTLLAGKNLHVFDFQEGDFKFYLNKQTYCQGKPDYAAS